MPTSEPAGEIVFNLEPSAEHPRNSEGAFVALKSGRILYYYTQFYGGNRDASPARIVGIHSDDQGRTWSNPPNIIVDNEGEQNVMSVSLLRLKSGKIALFYLVKNGDDDCRPFVRFSTDEAQSWSAPRAVIETRGYYVLNNDRVIQHSSGRLIAAVALHRSVKDMRSMMFWFLSDDEGQTWREAFSWYSIPAISHSGLQEPGVVEWFDASLYSWARTDAGAQFECRSVDGGNTWSPPQPSPLKSPLGPASIKMLPHSKGIVGWLALYNDHSGAFPFVPGRRNPLVAAISNDGRTWPIRKVVEYDPDSAFHYTAIHYTDDAVLLGYCAGDVRIGWLNRLRIRRLPQRWLFL